MSGHADTQKKQKIGGFPSFGDFLRESSIPATADEALEDSLQGMTIFPKIPLLFVFPSIVPSVTFSPAGWREGTEVAFFNWPQDSDFKFLPGLDRYRARAR